MTSFPVWGFWTGSITYTVHFRGRANQDVGPVSAISTAFPSVTLADLALVVADGGTAPLPQDAIVSTIVQHVMNSNLLSSWSPPQGLTANEYLTQVLNEQFGTAVNSGSSRFIKLIFNGQFGPLQIATA